MMGISAIKATLTASCNDLDEFELNISILPKVD